MTIKRIGPLSCAKITGVIYAAIGLLIGAMFSSFALFGLALAGLQRGVTENAVSPLVRGVMGVASIIVFPIIYGSIGFVSALIGAWIYNLVASKLGGIEIDVA